MSGQPLYRSEIPEFYVRSLVSLVYVVWLSGNLGFTGDG